MADRPKRKVEFIESYWTGGELGGDYQWNDNHGELVRCKDCKYLERLPNLDFEDVKAMVCRKHTFTGMRVEDWFCADGERKIENEYDARVCDK